MAPRPEPIILSDVALTLNGRAVLSGLTLTLDEARIGLLGRNGSGKTSLLRLIAGLIAPSSGTLRIGGTDPAADRRAALARVGVLFQNPDHQILFPTVDEELAFGLRQMGLSAAEALAQARAALQAEGRAHWAGVPTHALSQGQRQYLCLLSVLLMQPATLLLDEPFASLDLPTRLRLSRRLAGLTQRIIVIGHRPADMAGCTRLIWLEEGRIRADGGPEVAAAYETAMAELGARDADTDIAG